MLTTIEKEDMIPALIIKSSGQMTAIAQDNISTTTPINVYDQKKYWQYFCFVIGFSVILRLCGMVVTNLLVEEAYYWNYANHLDFSYLDHPPMVALIIKLFISIFGVNEWAIRFGSMVCWMLTAVFSYQLTNLLMRGAGQYAVFLLSILPFFFLQSLVMTPDQPLLVCWSAALFFLYRALVLEESSSWYWAGVWIGLGMLSKYTIVLLGPAILIYLVWIPGAGQWFSRKEPYLAALISLILFTPVIYWNAVHDWASFAFQGSRRFQSTFYFSFHHILGLLVLFLMPMGIVGLCMLWKKNRDHKPLMQIEAKVFLRVFTLFPLIIFSTFSLTREVKFNWIGPGLLALIPWLAIEIKTAQTIKCFNQLQGWLLTGIALMIAYSTMILAISFGTTELIHQSIFKKFIAWDDLTNDFYALAEQIEHKMHTTPIIVPLDLYNINSELSFYQAKSLSSGDIQKSYQMVGQHVFGRQSLMYRYWTPMDLKGKTLILVATDSNYFTIPEIKRLSIEKSPIGEVWSHSQGRAVRIQPYYYQVVKMN